MQVVVSQPAAIALQTLAEDDRRRVTAWCDQLANWENDDFVRDHAIRLSRDEAVYVLRASTDIRVFFTMAL